MSQSISWCVQQIEVTFVFTTTTYIQRRLWWGWNLCAHHDFYFVQRIRLGQLSKKHWIFQQSVIHPYSSVSRHVSTGQSTAIFIPQLENHQLVISLYHYPEGNTRKLNFQSWIYCITMTKWKPIIEADSYNTFYMYIQFDWRLLIQNHIDNY